MDLQFTKLCKYKVCYHGNKHTKSDLISFRGFLLELSFQFVD